MLLPLEMESAHPLAARLTTASHRGGLHSWNVGGERSRLHRLFLYLYVFLSPSFLDPLAESQVHLILEANLPV